jgi:hypothetical protein
MKTAVKRSSEEVKIAFKEFMRKKRESQEQARLELALMSQQGFFGN